MKVKLSNLKLVILILLTFLVVTVNPWWYKILDYSYLLAGLFLVASLLIVVLIYTKSYPNQKKIFLLILLLTTILFLSLSNQIDLNFGGVNSVQKAQLLERQRYLGLELGRAFLNKISLNYFLNYSFYFDKFERNLFYNLDLNQFFFASHPRERTDAFDFNKYLPIFLPFFLYGLYRLLNLQNKFLLILSLVLLIFSSLFSLNFALGPILLFPLINGILVYGLAGVLQRLLKVGISNAM